MRRVLMGSLTFAAAMSAVALSFAHIEVTFPAPRYTGNSTQKAGPCGMPNDARGDSITYLEPGSTVTLEWYESINHPGHYRIMFDDDGFDGFPDPTSDLDFCEPGTDVGCLADEIADAPSGPGTYSQDVTLPDIECGNCTLQLIQVMTDKPPWGDGNDIYYRCADIVLQAGAGGGPGTSSSSSTGTGTNTNPGAGGSGAGTGAGGSDGIDVSPSEGDESGCACRAGGESDAPAPAAAAALGLLALASRRRRRPAG